MKLLILTQKVDRDDPVLGFFHRWLEEFAKRFMQVTVICLEEGRHALPGNVRILSLGKERKSRGSRVVRKIRYIAHFYKYLWRTQGMYDAVFVHMNQEYVLLGGSLWKVTGKTTFLWRNHTKGDLLTRIAVILSDKVFCTSPESFTARFKKTKLVPVGVDSDFFAPDTSVYRRPRSILFLGRIAPVKEVGVFVEALRGLRDRGIEFSATIAGKSSLEDEAYEKMIRKKVTAYGLDDRVVFTGAVTRTEARKLYRSHAVYVNLTPSGSMDKTIFEALASGLNVLVANAFLEDVLPQNWVIADSESAGNLASMIKETLDSPGDYGPEARRKVAVFLEQHSLESLMRELVAAIAVVSK